MADSVSDSQGEKHMKRRATGELRNAIDLLPLETQRAMLEGVEEGRILAGAYVNRFGGVCPMFAAHREKGLRGAVSRLAGSWSPEWDSHTYMRGRPHPERRFAQAWDRYARKVTAGGARPATEDELQMLKTMLEDSIARAQKEAEALSGAVAEQAVAKATRVTEPRPAPAPERVRPEPRPAPAPASVPERAAPEPHPVPAPAAASEGKEPVRPTEPWVPVGSVWLRLCRTYDEYEAALRESGQLGRESGRLKREPAADGKPSGVPTSAGDGKADGASGASDGQPDERSRRPEPSGRH